MIKLIIISKLFLQVFLHTTGVLAQQGIVVAGGDATGPGGTMSFSIGQTDYLMYYSSHGIISLGLQQTFFCPTLIYEIPSTLITEGESICYNDENVFVAGDGKFFIVEPWGHADIIAGRSIVLKQGTHVEPHGSLHARISNVGCQSQSNILTADFDEYGIEVGLEFESLNTLYKIYPNPSYGSFILELFEFDGCSSFLLEIYSMLGNLILSEESALEQYNTFDLEDRPAGIYLIRVLIKDVSGVAKLIKQ